MLIGPYCCKVGVIDVKSVRFDFEQLIKRGRNDLAFIFKNKLRKVFLVRSSLRRLIDQQTCDNLVM